MHKLIYSGESCVTQFHLTTSRKLCVSSKEALRSSVIKMSRTKFKNSHSS